MQLQQMLFTQGFGTRRICAGLVQHGLVTVDGQACTDASADVEPVEGLRYTVDGQEWEFHEKAYLFMHKPAGFECSQKPGAWPSVYSLLPAPLRQRNVQAIGRLDQDTTGLLLFTDDGKFIHRMSSPKHHVPKVYRVQCARAVEAKQVKELLEGVVLNDDPKAVKAAAVEVIGEKEIDLTLTEGKYHQVKRMVAAVGNHVEGLHRWKIGRLELPAQLVPGKWQWISPGDL